MLTLVVRKTPQGISDRSRKTHTMVRSMIRKNQINHEMLYHWLNQRGLRAQSRMSRSSSLVYVRMKVFTLFETCCRAAGLSAPGSHRNVQLTRARLLMEVYCPPHKRKNCFQGSKTKWLLLYTEFQLDEHYIFYFILFICCYVWLLLRSTSSKQHVTHTTHHKLAKPNTEFKTAETGSCNWHAIRRRSSMDFLICIHNDSVYNQKPLSGGGQQVSKLKTWHYSELSHLIVKLLAEKSSQAKSERKWAFLKNDN